MSLKESNGPSKNRFVLFPLSRLSHSCHTITNHLPEGSEARPRFAPRAARREKQRTWLRKREGESFFSFDNVEKECFFFHFSFFCLLSRSLARPLLSSRERKKRKNAFAFSVGANKQQTFSTSFSFLWRHRAPKGRVPAGKRFSRSWSVCFERALLSRKPSSVEKSKRPTFSK
jgi:hypothetical protein